MNHVTTPTQFSEEDRNLIVQLTTQLTGANPESQVKLESCLVNIRRRMDCCQCLTLREYIDRVEESLEEFSHFISAVTIHTTSWFRELPHFDRLKSLAMNTIQELQQGKNVNPFKVLSAGCSTGEEVYSIALVLEQLRLQYPQFDYQIEGWDVDPISIAKGMNAIYSSHSFDAIPSQYYRSVLKGSGPTEGFFTFSQDIRKRCTFKRRSLVSPSDQLQVRYDLIFCRNVLIYFKPETVQQIVKNLTQVLTPKGHIILGHSEYIENASLNLIPLGNTTFRKEEHPTLSPGKNTAQNKLSEGKQIATLSPKRRVEQSGTKPDLILVGASTGGTEVLVQILSDLPRPCPPVMVVQHIAISFAQPFAERLAQASGLTLGTAIQGESLQPNHLYMALGDYHIGTKVKGGILTLTTSGAPPIHSVRPAVDILFSSSCEYARRAHVMAILLTGMGKDGAKGLAELRTAGATTFVQDEMSSTVFGMPKEAIALGAAEHIGNPGFIRQRLLMALKFNPYKAS